MQCHQAIPPHDQLDQNRLRLLCYCLLELSLACRFIVASRSGPTETHRTGTPTNFSIVATYCRARGGNSENLRTPVISVRQPRRVRKIGFTLLSW